MQFPSNEYIDMSLPALNEQQVMEAYKQHELIRFKANCRKAFQNRVDLYMKYEDHGVAVLEALQ